MTHETLLAELLDERFGPAPRRTTRVLEVPADDDLTCARRRRVLDEAFRETHEASA